MPATNDIIISAEGLQKGYTLGKRRQTVLRSVNLQVRRGEFLAIMGASGSGKSTLLHILGLLDRADEGTVWFEGQDVARLSQQHQNAIRNRQIGFVFQFYHLLPELNVLENVLLPEMVASSVVGWWQRRRAARQRAEEVLGEVGLAEQVKQRPATLSGGERQRVALARALMNQPRLLLADEPTGNLDSAAGKAILKVLGRLNSAGQTIVMVTHDQAVAELAERRVHLRDGKLG